MSPERWVGSSVSRTQFDKGRFKTKEYVENVMLPHTLQTRGVKLAFLFGPPRFIGRDDAAKLYSGVCDKLGYDDLTFRYSTTEAEAKPGSRGFAINLARKEGRGGFGIEVAHKGGPNEPFRLLLDYGWPPSIQHIEEMFENASTAVSETLPGEWQRVLAETRIRAQCQVQGQDSLAFIREHLICLNNDALRSFESPLRYASLRLEFSSEHSTTDAVAGPSRQLTIEPLREDRKVAYLELVSQWTQFSESGPGIDPTKRRPFDAAPQDYIKNSYDFLTGALTNLSREE